MTKQQFIINQLKPYLSDTSLCGYDIKLNNCKYITDDGKMCAIGKNLIEPRSASNVQQLTSILGHKQENLKAEVRNILNENEWGCMQKIHDSINSVSNTSLAIGILEKTAKVDLSELKPLALLLTPGK